MRVQAAPPEHYSWIAERASLVIGPAFRALEAVDGAGKVHGMVGFDCWTESAVSMHVALESPAALRHLLRPAFGIAFDLPPSGSGKRVAVCTVLSSNVRSLNLVRHIGFREVFRGRGWWGRDVDVVYLEMRRGACRWIAPEARREAA